MKKDLLSQGENEKPRVLVDLDGVIRNFVKGVEDVYAREYPDHAPQKVASRELHKYFPIGEGINEFIGKFGKEILLNSPPYPGSIETLIKWEEKFEIVIATAQPPEFRYPTFSWIGNHAIPTNEVKIIYEKQTVDGIALLDDFPENLELFAGTNRLAVCMDQPWNQHDWEGARVKTVEEFFQLVYDKLTT
jgi:5'(3')-deoxyribonucleotidase